MLYRIIFSLILSIACLSPLQADQTTASRPNILLILTDDMGWGDLGIFHQNQRRKAHRPSIKTPNLDRLATEGAQLRRHYSASPVCAPARASLFSGVHQGHAEVVRNSNFDAPLEDSHTLASVLREAGYSTALIGKWGLGGGKEQGGTLETSGAWPTKRGFDYFFGYNNHLSGHRHYPKEEAADDPDTGHNAIWDSTADTARDISQDCDGCYSTDLFTARAKKWIVDQKKASPDRPFFLALTLIAPHARLAVPAGPYPKGAGLKGGLQWLGNPGKMINTANPQKWDTFIAPPYAKQKDWPESARRHATMITRVDQAVGDLMQLLKDLHIDDRTMIVFLSDNGPHDEPGAVSAIPGHPTPKQDPSFFQSYGIFDGIKRDCLEGGMRVPALVRYPGVVKPRTVTLSLGQFQDWMATFADLAQVSVPMRSDGVSMMPLLRGQSKTQNNGIVYSEFFYRGTTPSFKDFAPSHINRQRGQMQIVFVDGFKGLRYNALNADTPFEIYDTAKDPGERNNLASSHPELQEKMKRAALWNRRAFDYKWQGPQRRNAISGATVFDSALVPAESPAPSVQTGLSLRCVKASPAWVPHFDTLPNASQAERSIIQNLAEHNFPAGTVTELSGYLSIPEDGSYVFTLKTDAVQGTKAYVKLHNFHLLDADKNHTPGKAVTSALAINAVEGSHGSGEIPLQAGLHPITITVVQGESADGKILLTRQKTGQAATPIPQEDFSIKK